MAMFNYMTTDFSTVEMLEEEEIEAEGNVLGPVVQSMVSLTSSLRGQLIMCFMPL